MTLDDITAKIDSVISFFKFQSPKEIAKLAKCKVPVVRKYISILLREGLLQERKDTYRYDNANEREK